MAWDDDGFVRQSQDGVVQGAEDFLHGAAGEIGAADGASEEGVAGDELLLGGEVETDATFGVAGSVEDIGGEGSGGDGFSGGDAAVDFDFAGGGDADPLGLNVEHFEQGMVILVEQNGSPGRGAELHGSADVVDVSVSDDDLLDLKLVLLDESLDVFDVIAGVDDHGFAGGFIADNGAIAAERAYGEDFVDHRYIVASPES